MEHLKQISEDSKNKVIITSPLVVNTPGEELLNGKREILVNDQHISINCQVEKIEGFENHSDYNQLLAYINRLRPKLRRDTGKPWRKSEGTESSYFYQQAL